jgi:CMP-N,N'-diacetyllegionaminic acid synthase
MSRTVALVPAKSRSTGIPSKNFRKLGGQSLMARAAHVGREAGCDLVVISSDITVAQQQDEVRAACRMEFIQRPAALAQDDTPMFEVVKHAADTLQLADEDVIVLLQPTQPFRTPEHVREAVRLLWETQADSMVSVVELPKTHHPAFQLEITEAGRLISQGTHRLDGYVRASPTRRQDVWTTYRRDGSVYAFWVKTVRGWGNIYGDDSRPLIIPPEQSCELDSEADFAEVERRWNARNAQ